MTTEKPANIAAYIANFPKETQLILETIRTTIKALVPESEETISYAMPAITLNKKALVYFAGYKHHIGFYATPTGHKAFEEELSMYKQGKGSVQFPLDKPIPYDLIKRIVAFRVAENSKPSKT
jgi:uncharacterized protein YdhG (YjbR/CyaY superfamily)